ncbi:CHASE2 domain-containing protein [Nostoc sp. CENA67]|uniref:CHASE2 domain-containing protein n=1 Tax=Amazonocrinis nigriterrae CENA67 TaxID=2794033 RepID=A0A8J7HS77_9NOST|nr:CHASE2 domain-containing protein [Amazonocrinis nigriterrae]MBH8564487.1 CHASE2 domain-containing protein [Amazonocrinis nigriterrae CENA67]
MDFLNLISALTAAATALITVLRFMRETENTTEPASGNGKIRSSLQMKKFQTAFLVSVIIVGLLMGIVRPIRILQPSELAAFDHLMRSRPIEQPDSRLLVVTVTEDDLEYQDQKNMERNAASLSSQALDKILRKLNQHQPRVIGLDIFRNFNVNPKFPELAKQFQKNDRLIATCSVGGTKAPPIITPKQYERLGFSNVPKDSNGVIRRQFLGMASDKRCPTQLSFSLQVALRYLQEESGISPITQTSDQKLQIGKVIFPKLVSDAGGYQLPRSEELGYQILLNYRSLKADQSIAQQITLTDILEGSHDAKLPSLVNDRIILIGTNAPKSFGDFHMTPYGTEMPGVLIQAHMVSQIISAVLDQRPLLWWWPQVSEMIWVWLWAFFVGILIEYWRSLISRALVVIIAIGILSGLCFLAFIQGGWLPLIPTILGLMLTAVCVVIALPHVQITPTTSITSTTSTTPTTPSNR